MKKCFPLGSRSLLYNEVDEESSMTLIAELMQKAQLWLNKQHFTPLSRLDFYLGLLVWPSMAVKTPASFEK